MKDILIFMQGDDSIEEMSMDELNEDLLNEEEDLD